MQQVVAIPAGLRRLPVVYVAGSGHTGSTLLALLLNEHPQIVSVGETAVKPKIRRKGKSEDQTCSCGQSIRSCPFWMGIFRRVRALGYELGPNRWSNDYRSENPAIHRMLTSESSHRFIRVAQNLCAHYLPVHASRMRRIDAVNVAFVRAALEEVGREVFVDTTKHPLRLSRMLALPELDVKVITLVRDARGYAASVKRRGGSLEEAAVTWRKDQEVIEHITHRLPEERTRLLRYEDLCSRPEQKLRELYAFCGVEPVMPVTTVIPRLQHVLGNSLRLRERIEVRLDESWRSRLTADEQQRVLTIAGVMNRRMGYE
jgi:hypothetical protein